jgi:small-conductance mechanosensitive channel
MRSAEDMVNSVQETILLSPIDLGLAILTLLIFSIVFSVRKIVLGFVWRKHKKNPASRQWVRNSRYIGLGVSLLLTIPLWFDTLENIGVFVGLLTAALAVSLSSPLQSIAGWMHLIVHQPYRVGDRVQIGNQSGIVQDIALFSTTLLETEEAPGSAQPTGRTLCLQNKCVFDKIIMTSAREHDFMWHETSMTFTYESDWRGANRSMHLMMSELLQQHHAEQRPRLEASWQVIEQNPSSPLLNEYVSAEDHGIQITLRFLCGIESAREIKHCFTTKMLHVVRVNNSLNLAYPTRRMVGPSESNVSNAPFPPTSPPVQKPKDPITLQEKPKRTFTHPIEKIEMSA